METTGQVTKSPSPLRALLPPTMSVEISPQPAAAMENQYKESFFRRVLGRSKKENESVAAVVEVESKPSAMKRLSASISGLAKTTKPTLEQASKDPSCDMGCCSTTHDAPNTPRSREDDDRLYLLLEQGLLHADSSSTERDSSPSRTTRIDKRIAKSPASISTVTTVDSDEFLWSADT